MADRIDDTFILTRKKVTSYYAMQLPITSALFVLCLVDVIIDTTFVSRFVCLWLSYYLGFRVLALTIDSLKRFPDDNLITLDYHGIHLTERRRNKIVRNQYFLWEQIKCCKLLAYEKKKRRKSLGVAPTFFLIIEFYDSGKIYFNITDSINPSLFDMGHQLFYAVLYRNIRKYSKGKISWYWNILSDEDYENLP